MVKMKLFKLLCAFVLYTCVVSAPGKDDNVTEQTTKSAIVADDKVLPGNALKPEQQKAEKEAINQMPSNAQLHTVADFIIHPVIALKARVPEAENAKQAAGSSTTSSPWQLFGFNAGQGLGSSVSSLAGTVTGWLGNRIQLTSLLDTPIREQVATSSTPTTVTPVRRQQQASTRKPLNSISNKNEPPFRIFNTPNHYYVVNYVDDAEESDDSNEYNDYGNFVVKRRRYQDYAEDDEEEPAASLEYQDNYEEDYNPKTEAVKRQNNPKRRPKPVTLNKRKNSYNLRGQLSHNQQRKQTLSQHQSDENGQYEDGGYYLNANEEFKRFQNKLNFRQQDLPNRLTQFRRGQQAPAVVLNTSNKPAPLVIERNGQTIYVAPELLQTPKISSNKVSGSTKKPLPSRYPHRVFIMPLKRKGQTTQYISIPWTSLGASNLNQLTSLTDGVQSQPVFLTVPHGAMKKMQTLSNNRKSPSLTADTVPLSAETVIKENARRRRIVPGRIPANIVQAARIQSAATLFEKAPPARQNENNNDTHMSSESLENDDHSTKFLVVADDATNTKISRSAYRQISDYFNQNRSERQLNDEKAPTAPIVTETKEQLIPVQIVTETEGNTEMDFKVTTESPLALESASTESQTVAALDNKFVEPNI